MELNQIKEKFIQIYGGTEQDLRIFTSPGRVNLIGEHVDYCGGPVFPAALSMGTTIVARKRDDDIIQLAATDLNIQVGVKYDKLNNYKDIEWGNYQLGVASELMKDGLELVGCDLLFDDTIPHGGGLSSSAAIEVATALCLTTFAYEKMGKTESVDMVYMAQIGQRAENNFVGVNCGIMDQFASAMGKKNHAIYLNCGDLSYSHVPLKIDGYKLVIANTNKKRSLADSKYNERRAECEEGLARLKTVLPNIACLADITPEQFEANKHVIENPIVQIRVQHVIYECDRVKKSVQLLQNNDILGFGKMVDASHDSLKDLYEVTGVELDTLVNEARKIRGTVGSRMTGAGFGGCTVNIVEDNAIDEFIKQVGDNYTNLIGYAPSFYISKIEDGGHEIK